MLRVQGLMAEGLQGLLIHQTTEILIVQSLDPLHLWEVRKPSKQCMKAYRPLMADMMSHGGQDPWPPEGRRTSAWHSQSYGRS